MSRTVEERVSALEAQMHANEAAMAREREVASDALRRAEIVLTKRFEAANEVRQAMLDREHSFVKVGEFRWAIGVAITSILILAGIIARLAL